MSLSLQSIVDPTGGGLTNVAVTVTCKGFMLMGCSGTNTGSQNGMAFSPDSAASIFDEASANVLPIDAIKLRNIGDSFKLCKESTIWYVSVEANGIGATTYYFLPITDEQFDCAINRSSVGTDGLKFPY